jgi:hypothetical protein
MEIFFTDIIKTYGAWYINFSAALVADRLKVIKLKDFKTIFYFIFLN